MDKNVLRDLIIKKLKETFKSIAPKELEDTIEDWMADEISHLIESTNQIKNEKVRTKSITLMFDKRYKKLQKLILILERNELLEDYSLFRDLLDII